MRKSVKKNDPGFSKDSYKYNAYLNGKKVEKCFTADEEKGFVDVYKSDGGNHVVVDGELQSERLYGKVEIKLKDD